MASSTPFPHPDNTSPSALWGMTSLSTRCSSASCCHNGSLSLVVVVVVLCFVLLLLIACLLPVVLFSIMVSVWRAAWHGVVAKRQQVTIAFAQNQIEAAVLFVSASSSINRRHR